MQNPEVQKTKAKKFWFNQANNLFFYKAFDVKEIRFAAFSIMLEVQIAGFIHIRHLLHMEQLLL